MISENQGGDMGEMGNDFKIVSKSILRGKLESLGQGVVEDQGKNLKLKFGVFKKDQMIGGGALQNMGYI